ncbi:hypothetical protein [Humidisolicoccus flavus]|uniref:hypothetical protein n=1 Tax=Humidisolicoccus flavus TaxID=3111414 RepID=UPI003254AA80
MEFLTLALEEAGHHEIGATPYFVGAIGALFFATIGAVTWSYRNVANRHSHKFENSTRNTSGHH